ncbi:hypothetical protein CYMTET_6990 [Cymbomonas tetramitiformis]|uniref:Uncharacterized protein n=1 Tax=Cymbomonas tetramitiformis TaxID=36881 RepID=A0AAE0LHI7_9CHLO|nr:hypothetical protein CYMTET_6990 [Cymbomonas tetramitiformis]
MVRLVAASGPMAAEGGKGEGGRGGGGRGGRGEGGGGDGRGGVDEAGVEKAAAVMDAEGVDEAGVEKAAAVMDAEGVDEAVEDLVAVHCQNNHNNHNNWPTHTLKDKLHQRDRYTESNPRNRSSRIQCHNIEL